MNKKNLSLIAGILALLVFIGFLGETGPKSFFGYSLNIWFFRIAWLFIAVTSFMRYFQARKSEKEST